MRRRSTSHGNSEMHEIAVLSKIISRVRAAAEAARVTRVRAIELELGELTGLMPVFFRHYYAPVTANDPLFRGSELIITTVPGLLRCVSCGASFAPAGAAWCCPHCGGQAQIERGRELIIKNITVETDETGDEHVRNQTDRTETEHFCR